ncbi:MAG: 23S rRNA (pseudouridine(1915)-N(3))-methyltransferase RlmH [Flavobacteriaceae bacterium]|nr:23S rRNA (pseudouridine(1915)-N(3))-methyltransferase RlmH [Flavobacteriaceae bacterium]
MKIQIISIGKTSFSYLDEGIELYQKRLVHYIPFEWIELPDVKKGKYGNVEQLKTIEGENFLKKIPSDAFVVLLDVKGKEISSEKFADFLNTRMISGVKNLCFVIGGAYGFSQEIYKRAEFKISLSKMTFSHQIIRVIFLEQLYRAMTILKGEPYHH